MILSELVCCLSQSDFPSDQYLKSETKLPQVCVKPRNSRLVLGDDLD